MTSRNLLIAFDPTDPVLDYGAAKQVIEDSGLFKAWWHHVPFVFMVATDMTAEAVSELLRPHAKGARFIVAAVDLADADGNLTNVGWDWIDSRTESLSSTAEHAS